MECRPPLLDSDINSTMEHDDNRTIVHNPVSLSGVGQQKRVLDVKLAAASDQLFLLPGQFPLRGLLN